MGLQPSLVGCWDLLLIGLSHKAAGCGTQGSRGLVLARWVELRPRISQGWCLPTSGQSWVLGSGYRAQGYQSLGQTTSVWGQGPVHLRAGAGLLMGEQDLQVVGLWFPWS